MSLLELFIIAVGLSMDAFAVAVGKGLSVARVTKRQAAITGIWFGGFQALMPIVGYLLGSTFASVVKSIDHWIAFVLLGVIGASMVRESFKAECDRTTDDFSPKTMFPLAVATSIDALAVGVSFAFLSTAITPAALFIGVVTFALSACGLYVGNMFGCRYKSKAELMGGVILIAMGIKILVEHLIK